MSVGLVESQAKMLLALVSSFRADLHPEFLALKHKSRIFGHSSNPVCGFSMMEQVRLCAVWVRENWLGPALP